MARNVAANHVGGAAGGQEPRGVFTRDNRHGRLQDISQDGRVTFADTFIGDLLGFDGQAGAQGAGMSDSMGGARRMTPEQLAAMQAAAAVPQAAPSAQPGPMQGPPTAPGDEVPRDENGNPLPVLPAETAPLDNPLRDDPSITPADSTTGSNLMYLPAVAALVRRAQQPGHAGRAAKTDLQRMGVGMDGEVLDPERAQAAGLIDKDGVVIDGTATDVTPKPAQVAPPPKQIENQGGPLAERTPNPPPIDNISEQSNALPKPATPNSTVDRNVQTTVSPEDAPIDDPMSRTATGPGSTPEPVPRTPPAETEASFDSDAFSGNKKETLTSTRLDDGTLAFRDVATGDFLVQHPDGGGAIRAPSRQILLRVLQAMR